MSMRSNPCAGPLAFFAPLACAVLAGALLAACAGPEGVRPSDTDAADATVITMGEEDADQQDADKPAAGDSDAVRNSDGGDDADAGDAEMDQELPDALTRSSLAAATYTHELFPAPITLVDGHYEQAAAPGSASKMTADLHPEVAYGDLDGDGDLEAIAVLLTSGGGSGTFRTLYAIDERAGGTTVLAAVDLGDRVEIDGLQVADRQVVVDAVTHGPDDPMCCPTQQETLRFVLRQGELQEAAEE